MTGARTLEQVLADWRGEAAVLRRRGHDAQAATIEQLAADVAGAAEDYPRRTAPELHPTEKRLT